MAKPLVFVFSKNRPDCRTPGRLEAEGIPFTLVLESLEGYSQQPGGRLLLPFKNRGIGAARTHVQEVMGHSGSAWLLDDDMLQVYDVNPPPWVVKSRTTFSSVMQHCEDIAALFASANTNISGIGPRYAEFIYWRKESWTMFRPPYCFALVNLGSPVRYDPSYIVREDLKFYLENALQGFIPVTVNSVCFRNLRTRVTPGGCHEYYEQGLHRTLTQRLVELYPDYLEITDKGHRTNWKRIAHEYHHNLRPEHNPDPGEDA